MARSFHKTVLLRKLQQAVSRAADQEVGGCLLPDEQCTITGRPVAEVLRGKHPDMRVLLWKTPHVQPSRSMGMCPNGTPRLHGG